MDIENILPAGAVELDHPAASKKRAIEAVGESIAAAEPELDPKRIFDRLIARERLGSTGLGDGVALPHARVPEMAEPHAALLRLATPVDYDAPDGVAVDLVFGLLVPEESTEEHLQILAAVAAAFSDARTREALRAAVAAGEARRVLCAGARGA